VSATVTVTDIDARAIEFDRLLVDGAVHRGRARSALGRVRDHLTDACRCDV
jgi:hypothetical protein